MLAVSFFFVLLGASLFIAGITGLILRNFFMSDNQGLERYPFKTMGGLGLVCCILGLLVAMT